MFRLVTGYNVQSMVRYVPVAWFVGVCSFGEGLALWVLLSRVDRDRRAERSGLVLRIRVNLITESILRVHLTLL